MNTYPTLINEQSVTIFKGSNRLIAHSNHPLFDKIKNRIRAGNYNNIEQLFKIKDTIEQHLNLKVKNGRVFYKKTEINNAISNKILQYIKDGLDFKPLSRFINRLYSNSRNHAAANALCNYIDRYEFPIDSQGRFYATKAINSNWTDKHSGKIKNNVGKTVKVDKKKVSVETQGDFCNCFGLYAGSLNGYVLSQFGKTGDRVITVQICPEHVRACPADANYSKIRCYRYKVYSYLGKVEELKDKDVVKHTHNSIKNTDTTRNFLKQKRNSNGRFVKM